MDLLHQMAFNMIKCEVEVFIRSVAEVKNGFVVEPTSWRLLIHHQAMLSDLTTAILARAKLLKVNF